MPLHPQVKTVLDMMAAAGPPLHKLSPQEGRKAIEAMRANTGEVERVQVVGLVRPTSTRHDGVVEALPGH
jgi:hypothetical protein